MHTNDGASFDGLRAKFCEFSYLHYQDQILHYDMATHTHTHTHTSHTHTYITHTHTTHAHHTHTTRTPHTHHTHHIHLEPNLEPNLNQETPFMWQHDIKLPPHRAVQCV